MNKSLLTLAASALLLAGTMSTAQAQTSGDDDTMQQNQQGQQGQQGKRSERMKQYRDGRKDRKHRRDGYGMRHHGMGYGMGHGMMGGQGMMGQGMGHGPMMDVVFAIMDADGNGSLSLQEVQDAHARIFAHMDENDDDQVTKEEIKAFFRGKSGRDGDRAGRSGSMDDTGDMDNMDDADDDATQTDDND